MPPMTPLSLRTRAHPQPARPGSHRPLELAHWLDLARVCQPAQHGSATSAQRHACAPWVLPEPLHACARATRHGTLAVLPNAPLLQRRHRTESQWTADRTAVVSCCAQPWHALDRYRYERNGDTEGYVGPKVFYHNGRTCTPQPKPLLSRGGELRLLRKDECQPNAPIPQVGQQVDHQTDRALGDAEDQVGLPSHPSSCFVSCVSDATATKHNV
eukprot:1667615-Prymnesium_polylepis.2